MRWSSRRSAGEKCHHVTSQEIPEWKDTKAPRILTYTFKVLRRERVTKDFPRKELSFSPDEFQLEQATPLREYLFGAVDESRIAVGTGRDLVLNPPQAGEPLNYFMYPYAEADGKSLNEDLYGFNIGYTVRFKEM